MVATRHQKLLSNARTRAATRAASQQPQPAPKGVPRKRSTTKAAEAKTRTQKIAHVLIPGPMDSGIHRRKQSAGRNITEEDSASRAPQTSNGVQSTGISHTANEKSPSPPPPTVPDIIPPSEYTGSPSRSGGTPVLDVDEDSLLVMFANPSIYSKSQLSHLADMYQRARTVDSPTAERIALFIKAFNVPDSPDALEWDETFIIRSVETAEERQAIWTQAHSLLYNTALTALHKLHSEVHGAVAFNELLWEFYVGPKENLDGYLDVPPEVQARVEEYNRFFLANRKSSEDDDAYRQSSLPVSSPSPQNFLPQDTYGDDAGSSRQQDSIESHNDSPSTPAIVVPAGNPKPAKSTFRPANLTRTNKSPVNAPAQSLGSPNNPPSSPGRIACAGTPGHSLPSPIIGGDASTTPEPDVLPPWFENEFYSSNHREECRQLYEAASVVDSQASERTMDFFWNIALPADADAKIEGVYVVVGGEDDEREQNYITDRINLLKAFRRCLKKIIAKEDYRLDGYRRIWLYYAGDASEAPDGFDPPPAIVEFLESRRQKRLAWVERGEEPEQDPGVGTGLGTEVTKGYNGGGRTRKSDLERALELKKAFIDAIIRLAREIGKSPQTLMQAIGYSMVNDRDINSWNLFQIWIRAEDGKGLKRREDESEKEFSQRIHKKYLKWKDSDKYESNLEKMKKWYLEKMQDAMTALQEGRALSSAQLHHLSRRFIDRADSVYQTHGVVVFGWTVDPQTGKLIQWGAGQMYENMRFANAAKLEAQQTDYSAMLHMEWMKLNDFATLPSEIIKLIGIDTSNRSQLRSAFAQILILNLREVVPNTSTKNIMWKRFANMCYKNQVTLVNWQGKSPGFDSFTGIHDVHVDYLELFVQAWIDYFKWKNNHPSQDNDDAVPSDDDSTGSTVFDTSKLVQFRKWSDEELLLPIDEQGDIPIVISKGDEVLCRVDESDMWQLLNKNVEELEGGNKRGRKKSRKVRRPVSSDDSGDEAEEGEGEEDEDEDEVEDEEGQGNTSNNRKSTRRRLVSDEVSDHDEERAIRKAARAGGDGGLESDSDGSDTPRTKQALKSTQRRVTSEDEVSDQDDDKPIGKGGRSWADVVLDSDSDAPMMKQRSKTKAKPKTKTKAKSKMNTQAEMNTKESKKRKRNNARGDDDGRKGAKKAKK